MVMGIDDNLLNKRSSDTSSDNKKEENKTAPEAADSINSLSVDDRAAGFIQNQVEARQQKAAAKAQDLKKNEAAKSNKINAASGSCLQKAWLNLIPSWGLTLIWINIHVFLNKVVGEKVFCKLGMEWVPSQIQKSAPEEAKKIGGMAAIPECAGLACLDLGCLLIIIAVSALLYTLFDNVFVKFFSWLVNLF